MLSCRREIKRFAKRLQLISSLQNAGLFTTIQIRLLSFHHHHSSMKYTCLNPPIQTHSRIYFFSSSSSSPPPTVAKKECESIKTDPGVTVPIIFVDKTGKEIPVSATVGKNLLEIAHENNIELEGACGGELACATCHLVFEPHIYASLPNKVPEEEDMLDLAFKLTDTSRLGCQIRVQPYMAGMKVQIPDDGY